MAHNVNYKNKHGKIDLPWAANEELNSHESATGNYWKVALAWNGKESPVQTVQDAIQLACKVLKSVDPNCMLAHRTRSLKDDVVIHSSKKMKAKHDRLANISEPPVGKMIVL